MTGPRDDAALVAYATRVLAGTGLTVEQARAVARDPSQATSGAGPVAAALADGAAAADAAGGGVS